MPTEEARRQRAFAVYTALIALFVSLLASGTSAYLAWDRATVNHHLICELDDLFGNPTKKQLSKATPTQRRALNTLKRSC